MGYKKDAVMDSGYYMGGFSDGLLYFPPTIPGDDKKEPILIPWSELLNDEEIDNAMPEMQNEQDIP